MKTEEIEKSIDNIFAKEQFGTSPVDNEVVPSWYTLQNFDTE